MKNFNDDDFNDFFEDWEKFNYMMNNNRSFKNEMTELLRKMMDFRDQDGHFDFRIIPLSRSDRKFYGFNLPEDEMTHEKGSDENGEWESKHWESPDGTFSYTSFSRTSTPEGFGERFSPRRNPRQTKLTQEETTKLQLGKLKRILDMHVEREEYEKAAEVKKLMDQLTSENKTEE